MKNSDEWHTLAEASRMLGKNNRYVSNWIKCHDNFPEPMLMDISGKKFIHDKGIQWISENTKKGGVLKSRLSAIEDKFLKLTVLGNTLRTILHGREWVG
ncbi:hypothetical protein [Pediococcus pentosaceus]|uniref:hypothetical protein n=1 Tax=Pediococcus pentosaceus TaxID=1255 RepID=UPI0013302282|nr:hypothetical protein [Pediococcus pentosaceus]KAF0504860.1 hypothetical protein GBP24_09035 [Pediococcus pentosaceus]